MIDDAVSTVVLPKVIWKPTPACGSRYGSAVNLVVVHRWGSRFTNPTAEEETYDGVVNFFMDPNNSASAHLVFPGSAAPGEVTQMVAWDQMAWTEAAYNPVSDDIETADALWIDANPKPDAVGLAVLARIVACRLHKRGLPPVWSTHRGFCRHGDLGASGGGHYACPTTNMTYWKSFVGMVQREYARSGCSTDPKVVGR